MAFQKKLKKAKEIDPKAEKAEGEPVGKKDPDAASEDTEETALHGAKLLSAIANAHVDHLSQMQAKKITKQSKA